MLIDNNIAHFYYNFDVCFLNYKSLLFVKGLYGFKLIRLPNKFFFKKEEVNFSLQFSKKYFFFSFMAHFSRAYNNVTLLFFAKLKLRGLGYRIRPMAKSLLRIFMGFTNYIFFHIPRNIFIKPRRRRMIIIANDYGKLRTLLANFFLLKTLSPYRLRGIFYPKQIILMKPGKKRF